MSQRNKTKKGFQVRPKQRLKAHKWQNWGVAIAKEETKIQGNLTKEDSFLSLSDSNQFAHIYQIQMEDSTGQ